MANPGNNFFKTAAQTRINSTSVPNTTAGDDNIGITSGSFLTATHTIDGGAGNDTIFVGGATSTAQTFNFGAAVTNIETIKIANLTNAGEEVASTAAHRVNAAALTQAVTIIGNAGNNLINAGTANDTVLAGAGNDTVNGNDGNDSLDGGLGNDSLTGGLGNDFIDGGIGNDIIVGGIGNDSLIGGEGNDSLDAGDGTDVVNGGAGNDTINGGAGTDTLFGGAGDDLFVVTRGSDVTLQEGVSGDGGIDGGEGADQIRFASTTAGDTLNLNSNVAVESVVIGTGVAAAAVTTAKTALNVNASQFISVTRVPVDEDQVLDNIEERPEFVGLSITGNAGNNIITGSSSNDTIIGGAGADTLRGGNGSDTYIYNTNTEFATGETITDTGAYGFDTIQINGSGVLKLTAAVTGIERVDIGNGVTNLAGGVDASALAFNQNTVTRDYDWMTGETYYGGGGIEIDGNSAANNITGTAFGDLIYAAAGNDIINAGAGDDTIYGEAGTDTLNGGFGNDVFYGDSADSINGGTDPVVEGAAAENDVLYVSGTYRQATNTRLTGIETIEILETFVESPNNGGPIPLEFDFDGSFVGGSVTLTGQTEAFTVIGTNSADIIIGGTGNDTIYGSEINDGDIRVQSKRDSDVADNLVGGAGNDVIYASNLDYFEDSWREQGQVYLGDSVDGGVGTDTLVIDDRYFYAGDTELNGSGAFLKGIEVISASEYTQPGRPIFDGNGNIIGSETFTVGINTEIDLSQQTEAFGIIGKGGNDTLTGGAGADTINAGDGVDTIFINSVDDYAFGEVIDGGAENFNYGGHFFLSNDYSNSYGDTIVFNVFDADADKTITLTNVSNIENVILDTYFAEDQEGEDGIVNINIDASQVFDAVADIFIPFPTENPIPFGVNEPSVRINGLYISGTDGDNFILGTELNDTIFAGEGNDIIDGGNDVGFYGNVIGGNYGGDTAVFDGDIDDYVIARDNNGVFTVIDKDGEEGVDTVRNIENFIFDGSFYNANFINTFAVERDADKLADNVLDSDYNFDTLFDGGAGNDMMYGGYGDDYFLAGDGDDVVFTTIDGDYDSVLGGAGNDVVVVGATNNESPSPVTQIRVVFDGFAVGDGDAYNDNGQLAVRLLGEIPGTNNTLGNGVLRADDEGTIFVAAYGSTFDVRDQSVTPARQGDGFNVVVLGTSGDDVYDSGTSTAFGEESDYLNYYVHAGRGDDVVESYYGDDYLVGGQDNDTLSAGDGEDTLVGGDGSDVLNLGLNDEDSDTVIIRGELNSVTSYGGVFTFTSDVDVINNFEAEYDLLSFPSLSLTRSEFVNGSLADNSYTFVQGTFDLLTNQFTSSAEGLDTLVVYDQNLVLGAGNISTNAVVLTGVIAEDLSGDNVFSNPVVAG